MFTKKRWQSKTCQLGVWWFLEGSISMVFVCISVVVGGRSVVSARFLGVSAPVGGASAWFIGLFSDVSAWFWGV